MNKYKELEKLNKLKEKGVLNQEEFEIQKKTVLENVADQEVPKKKKHMTTYIIIGIIFIIICACTGMLWFFREDIFSNYEVQSNDGNNANSNVNIYTESISFSSIQADDEKLDATQKEIINYFDDDYITISDTYYSLLKYPQLFNKAKIYTRCGVAKILKSDNSSYEAICFGDGFGYYYGEHATGRYNFNTSNLGENGNRLCIIKGAQIKERLVQNDYIDVRGRYVGTKTIEVNGKTYTLPVINIININYVGEEKYSIDTIRTVAEHVFGKDIKITSPEPKKYTNYYGETWKEYPDYYIVTLDNQSNANFKSFKMSKTSGEISYYYDIDDKIKHSIVKRLFISADFNHFIVTTYDENLRYVYIDYFDKNLKKIWGREFAYTSNDLSNQSPIDYNKDTLAVVIDNDLYILDINTGKNKVEPVLVGEKTRVLLEQDGVILIGEENKDLIMKVNFAGKILYRLDGDTKFTSIYSVFTQNVNGKWLFNIYGLDQNVEDTDKNFLANSYIEKYILLNKEGTIEISTKDISTFAG